jgi:hypothetical protein
MKEYKKYIKTIVYLSLLLGYAPIPMANAIKGMTYHLRFFNFRIWSVSCCPKIRPTHSKNSGLQCSKYKLGDMNFFHYGCFLDRRFPSTYIVTNEINERTWINVQLLKVPNSLCLVTFSLSSLDLQIFVLYHWKVLPMKPPIR